MAEPVNQNEILEESRRAAVQTIANVFSGLSKVRKLRRRTIASYDDDRQRASGDDAKENATNDFLFDLLKLNATYLNEAARLGKSYTDLAYRALENMYQIAHPRLKNQTADELVFSRSHRARKLVVQNDLDPEISIATLELPAILDRKTGDWNAVFAVSPKPRAVSHGGDDRRTIEIDAPFGQPRVLTLTAELSALEHRTREDYIYVRMRAPGSDRVRERRIPIVLDSRS